MYSFPYLEPVCCSMCSPNCCFLTCKQISQEAGQVVLNCEVKWAIRSITMNKASGGDGIPVELFQILKDDAVEVLHSIYQQIWKTQQWPQDWKSQFSFQSQRKAMPKYVQTTTQLHSFHMWTRSCSKSSKIGFNRMWTENFQVFKLDLEKARNQRSNCQHSLDHRKARKFQKNIYFCSIDYAKAFDYVDHSRMWKILKRR